MKVQFDVVNDALNKILLTFVVLASFLHARADNWMARLPDDALVAEVSIPGAHDAATGSGWAGLYGPIGNKFAKTQDLDLRQLWEVGIRAFDLRPAMHKHYMSLNHGMVPTRLHFDDVLYQFRDWLRDNPSEFIVIHLLHAGDGDKVKDSYETRLQQLLTRLDLCDWLADFRPDLRVGDVRGKILILSRNRYSDRPVGGYFVGWTGSADWRRQTQGRIIGKGNINARVYMQDFSSTYAKGALDIKTAAVTRMLDFSTTHRAVQSSDIVWILNFCSAYSKVARLFGRDISTSNGYRDNAVHTHAAFLHYLHTHKAGPTGIVLMDYAGVDRSHGYQVDGQKMVRAIIATNFN